jgi:hypothetical protein
VGHLSMTLFSKKLHRMLLSIDVGLYRAFLRRNATIIGQITAKAIHVSA